MRWKVGIVLCVAALLAAWWLRGHHHGNSTSSTATGSATTSSDAHAHHRGPQAPATLSGKVTRKADGGAIAGATVAIARAELGAEILPSQAPTLVVITSAAGTWKLTGRARHVHRRGYLTGPAPRQPAEARRRRGRAARRARSRARGGRHPGEGHGDRCRRRPDCGARITLKPEEDFSLSGHADFVAMTAADGTYRDHREGRRLPDRREPRGLHEVRQVDRGEGQAADGRLHARARRFDQGHGRRARQRQAGRRRVDRCARQAQLVVGRRRGRQQRRRRVPAPQPRVWRDLADRAGPATRRRARRSWSSASASRSTASRSSSTVRSRSPARSSTSATRRRASPGS